MRAEAQAGGGGGPAGDGHWLGAERVQVYSWMILVIFAVLYVVWLGSSLPRLIDPRGKPFGYDFIAFWSAARLALAGRPAATYDLSAIAAMHRVAVPALRGMIFAWHYPPTFLLAVLPLGLLGYPAALAAFVLSTAALWAALIRRLVADRRIWIVAAAAPAGLINLLDGQNGFLTAGLAGFALVSLARRPVVAGVFIGLLAIKPHLAVLFPLALLAEGRWRALAAAALTALLFAAVSTAVFGWGTAAAFLHDLPLSRALIDHAAIPWGAMPSPYVFALSMGLPPGAAAVQQGIMALLAAACVWRAWHNGAAPFEAKAATLLAGSLLVSPFLFNYDMLWAALAVGWLALLGMRTGFARGEREILLFAWLVPALMQPVYALSALPLGFPALLLVLLVAIRRAAPLTDGEWRYLRSAVDALREARWVTRERLMRWGIGFAMMSLALLAAHVVTHTRVGLTDGNGGRLGNDFVNYWTGAQIAASRQPSLAYDLRADPQRAAGPQPSLVYDPLWFYGFEQRVTGDLPEFMLPGYRYGYPPIAMLLSLPLALFAFIPGLIAWSALGIGICVALLRRLAGWRVAVVALIGTPAALFNLIDGQNGFYTAALLSGGLMVIDRRPILAGICLGCLSYKPQMGLLLPVALAAGGRWRTFVAAAATVTLLALASLALFGTATWGGFFDQMGTAGALLRSDAAIVGFFHRMPTVFSALRVSGAAPAVAYAVQAVSAVAAAAAVAITWRRPGPPGIKFGCLMVAIFLATPYALDYDMIMLIFAAAWLAQEGMRTGFRPWERIAIVTLLVLPLVAMVTTRLVGVQVGPVVLWLLLAVLVRRCLADGVASPAAAAGPRLVGAAAAQPGRG